MFFRRLFKIIQAVFIILMCAILFVNLYLLTARLIFKSDLPKIFGFAQIIVISGSMQPAIDVGDMLVIQEQSAYKVNDIVTYNLNQNLITHRVIDITDTGFITQGDANNVADDPVPVSDVEGKVVLQIPGVGNLLIFLKTPFGILLMLAVLFLLIEIPYAIERLKQKNK